jgi:hypothetical protein
MTVLTHQSSLPPMPGGLPTGPTAEWFDRRDNVFR